MLVARLPESNADPMVNQCCSLILSSLAYKGVRFLIERCHNPIQTWIIGNMTGFAKRTGCLVS